MLSEIKQSYHECAAGLGDYTKIPKQKLADDFCAAVKSKNQLLRDQCFAALILRYWYKIGRYYQASKTAFTLEDCYEWLVHALLYALNHHPWLIPGNALFNDPNGADKTINRCVISTRLIAYQHSNTDKNKITSTSTSLDMIAENIGDAVYDNQPNLHDDFSSSNITDIVIRSIAKHNFMEAFIIDGICNYDVFTEKESKVIIPSKTSVEIDDDGNEYTLESPERSYKKKIYSFNQRKLIKHLNSLDNDFSQHFSKLYGIDIEIIKAEANKIKELTSSKLNKQVTNTLDMLKKDAGLLEYLC